MLNQQKIADRVVAKIAKSRPNDLFGATFFDIREKAKQFKKVESEKAIKLLENSLIKDLSSKGVQVLNSKFSLGQYRGSQFVTSAKMSIGGIRDEKAAEELAGYLRGKYSPKFKLKSFSEGRGEYNIR